MYAEVIVIANVVMRLMKMIRNSFPNSRFLRKLMTPMFEKILMKYENYSTYMTLVRRGSL